MNGKELSVMRMELGLTQKELADLIGVSRGYLSKVEINEGDPIPKQLLFRLRKKFPPDIRQLANLVDGLADEISLGSNEINDSDGGYSKRTLIPYYDVDVLASPIEVFNDQTMAPTFKIDLPGFADCDFAINVAGHSMYPTIESGTMILCKRLQDKSLIIPGEIYFIVTADYRMVKRLKKSEKKGWVIAASDNHNGHNSPDGQTYGSMELPLDKILHIYLVKGNIKRHQI